MDGRLPGGFGFPLGCTIVASVALVADIAGATEHPGYAVVPLALVVFIGGVMTRVPAALGVTAVAWAVISGFFYGRSGSLIFDTATGRIALVFLGAVALGGLTRVALQAHPPVALATLWRSSPFGTAARRKSVRQAPRSMAG